MKNPISDWQWFLRELRCWALGHQWKHGPTKKSEWYDLEDARDDEHGGGYLHYLAPYVVRKRMGNHLFESVAWWSAKCTVCRHKTRPNEEPWIVWHRRMWNAVRYGLFRSLPPEWKWWQEEISIGNVHKGRFYVAFLPMEILERLEQAWWQFTWSNSQLPMMFGFLFTDLRHKLMEWVWKEEEVDI